MDTANRTREHARPASGNGAYNFTAVGSAKAETVTHALGTDFRVVSPRPGDSLLLLFPLTNTGSLSISDDGVDQPFNPQSRTCPQPPSP